MLRRPRVRRILLGCYVVAGVAAGATIAVALFPQSGTANSQQSTVSATSTNSQPSTVPPASTQVQSPVPVPTEDQNAAQAIVLGDKTISGIVPANSVEDNYMPMNPAVGHIVVVHVAFSAPTDVNTVVPVLIDPSAYKVPAPYIAQLNLAASGVTGLDVMADLDSNKVVSVLVPPDEGTIKATSWVGTAPPAPASD
jgi:cytoskeletal protein RodZ